MPKAPNYQIQAAFVDAATSSREQAIDRLVARGLAFRVSDSFELTKRGRKYADQLRQERKDRSI